MSNRIDKVNSLLKKEISKIVFKEFDFSGAMVTLTRVECAANLFEAKVFISVLPDEKLDFVVGVLNKNAGDVQFKLNRILRMRPVPRIKFFKDETTSKAGKVEELLYKIKEENPNRHSRESGNPE